MAFLLRVIKPPLWLMMPAACAAIAVGWLRVSQNPKSFLLLSTAHLYNEVDVGDPWMSELEKLTVLRKKLVNRRRFMVGALQDAPEDHLTAETFTRIQHAIEAVDRAITDEQKSSP